MKQDLVKSNKGFDEVIQELRAEINLSKEHCEKLRL
jgi:hypothetical protein